MKMDKTVALALIILVTLAGIAIGLYIPEILEGMKEPVVETGDFVELYYIGYLPNGTVFDSSITDTTNVTPATPLDGQNYSLTPLQAYVGEGSPTKYPEGWVTKDYGVVEGFWKGLLGLEEGNTVTIGPIPPEEGYGLPVTENITFSTNALTGIRQTFTILTINTSDELANLSWVAEPGEIFTMPQYWGITPILSPHWLWENATEVVSRNDTMALVKTTPNKLEDLTYYPIDIFENKSTATFDEDTISITTTPEEGASTDLYGANITVQKVTSEIINVSIVYAGNVSYEDLPRTEVFNRTMELERIFEGIPLYYLEEDLADAGYGTHELSGQSLYFKVKILSIYKVS